MTSPLNWDIKSERKQEAQRRCSAAPVTAHPCAVSPLPGSVNHRPQPCVDTCDLPASLHTWTHAAGAWGMLKQRFLQLPPGKPAAHGVQRSTDLTPGLMQNNMGFFLKEYSPFLGSRVHVSTAPGIGACSRPPTSCARCTIQELPGAVYRFISLFKSRERGMIS